LSEILPPSDLVPGPDEVDQNYSTNDVTHKKSKTQKQKKCFSLRTRRLAKSFEDLNSSLAQSTEELWTCEHTCKLLC